MREKIKLLLKKLKIFKPIRKTYNFFFKHGYIYQKFQRYFINIKIRQKMAVLEKKLIGLVFFKNKLFFKKNINDKNIHSIQLKKKGVTDTFEIPSVTKNKELFFKYFVSQKIFSDKNPDYKFYLNDRDKNLEVGFFDNEITAKCPYIFDVVNDPYLIETLSTFFKCPYKLDYMSAWWSFKNSSNEPSEKTQYFHRDLDNFNFAKLFLYLTDVDDGSGAHQYIKYSHEKKIENKISTKTVDYSKLKENINDNDINTFQGKAGSLVLENTFGLHRAKTPKEKDRLMIVMAFSLVKTPYSPSKPLLEYQDIISEAKDYNKFINQNYLV